ncbi:type I restriction enzyme M protein [Clostridium tetanomorphum]|uniref:HsdM family class I SAM-dependent methyltransferase n=1 Tax=Clostridium tetanomorphum TaxID=1553 RepID=UPI00044A1D70|nr:N-6 DNA methylase [Clostridium tetanomorphum]KAJ49385.1 N-6 DNA methylase [Clostridium tetanomorphum DSM 665]KAJ51224.1 N-6 DNA methylase [Clostridium tetanomorphum DSM 665]MBP1863687.1 type I restriction enzyme M protein [Clostridium tetanomorphum]NRS86263.1 type I restriction enzyme M protein [Clostridium tetanomorphum]SQC00730.1 N-6 DNA methylase [Clostridium tetanomorphum]
MKQLKNKIIELGYDSIKDISKNTFIGSNNQVSVYVKQVEDAELKPELVNSITYEAMEYDPMPEFVWITNGDSNAYVLVAEEKSLSEIPKVISDEEIKSFGKKYLSEKDKWSLRKYHELQEVFDAIHELIYSSKDHVDSKNDAIDELCKLIFMEVFKLNNADFQFREGKLIGKYLKDILNYSLFEKAETKEAKIVLVENIREAFKQIKNHPDYDAILDDGTRVPIFSQDDYLKLENPNIYKEVLEALQNLGDILNEDGTERPANLMDLSGDILGRVFDVLLRGKFDSKGGLGIYLTPRQVTEAAVEMVFNDLIKDGTERIFEVDPETGIPTIRFADLCCGSAGFIIKCLLEMKNLLFNKLTGDKEYYKELFEKMKKHSFIGADNSPGMILKARINMALHGASKAPIFQTKDSLRIEHIRPESLDVVVTNPPFSKSGVSKQVKSGKKTIESPDGVEVITKFSEDIDESGKNRMSSIGLSLGSKPDSRGIWREVNSIDPTILFIDKYLQLLKPGGLLMIVVPDGILSNSGYKYVREYLIGNKNLNNEFVGGKAILKAVVSLPQETFGLSGAGAKTSLLYIQKKKHPGEKQGEVFMAVADEIGFTVKKNVEIQLGDDHNDLLKIIDAYKSGKSDEQ